MNEGTVAGVAVLPSPLASGACRTSRDTHRFGPALAAVLLLLVALPVTWSRLIDRPGETGLPMSHERVDAGVRQNGAAGVDVNGAVERMAHTPVAVPGRPGTLEVGTNAYHARFEAHGVTFTPASAKGSLGIQVTSVSRGGAALPVSHSAWAAEGAAATRRLGAGVQERASTSSSTVEWDVVLDSAPAGAGDLALSAELTGVSGAPAPTTTADGTPALRFELRGGGSAMVDELVVIDARGAVLHRSLPTVDGDRLVLRVPGSILDRATYPLTIDPTVSGPTVVANDGYAPSVASDGSSYLVVWSQPFGGDFDILGARLASDGSVLNGPFIVSAASNDEQHPDIAWNSGTATYLVVWEYKEAAPLNDYDINGQRLSQTGGLVGNNFVVYGPSSSAQVINERHPSVAANSVNWFVAWDDNPNQSVLGADIYGKMISGSGAVGFATRYAESSKDEINPDVAWNGSTFLIAYVNVFSSTDSDIYGVIIDPNVGTALSDGTPNGAKYGSNFAIDSSNTNQYSVGIASEGYANPACIGCGNPLSIGGPFLVTYSQLFNNTEGDVYGTLLDWQGTPIKAKFEITTSSNSEVVRPTTVAFNGKDHYLVLWDVLLAGPPYYKGAYAARVGRNGDLIDSPGFAALDTPNAELFGAVWAGPNDNWGVAAQSNNGSGNSILFSRVAPK